MFCWYNKTLSNLFNSVFILFTKKAKIMISKQLTTKTEIMVLNHILEQSRKPTACFRLNKYIQVTEEVLYLNKYVQVTEFKLIKSPHH